VVGSTVLDVGTNLGFLPVLPAGQARLSVVGCDNRRESVGSATELAKATNADRARFLLRNVLAPDFATLGSFDTVTSVHLLEHLTEEQLPIALSNMLDVTRHRLIISVPYEDTMEQLYGHEQQFTPGDLGDWAEWCIQRLGGGQFWCEQVEGGLLVVDRSS
jgi:SAM-dependent methyltransferase